MIKAYAAMEAGKNLEVFDYEAEPLKEKEVQIKVESCGICHSEIQGCINLVA